MEEIFTETMSETLVESDELVEETFTEPMSETSVESDELVEETATEVTATEATETEVTETEATETEVPEGAFGDLTIDLVPTLIPEGATMGAPGSVDVTITNEGNQPVVGGVDVDLYVSSDSQLNTRVLPRTGIEVNDGFLTTEDIELGVLDAGESQTFTIDYENVTSFVPPGSQFLIAQIDGESLGEEQDIDLTNNVDFDLVSAPNTDVVLDWMATGMNMTSNQYLFDEFEEVGAAPPEGTRAGAMLAASMFNAYGGVTGEYQPYAIDLENIGMSPEGASAESAIAGAAYTVLSELFPEQEDQLRLQMENSMEEIEADPISEMLGMAYGQRVAQELLKLRADELEVDDPDNYEFVSLDENDDFFWDPEDNGLDISVGAGYADDADPWAISSTDDILALASPNPRDSTEYLSDLEAVAAFGGAADTETTEIMRTEDQTEIAKFYFVDRGDSYKPNKHLNHILSDISIEEGLSVAENVENFFLVNVALADAVQVAWDAKYTHQIPRPSQPINDLIDPEWEPFLENPPFPDFVSGHGTMGYTFATVAESIFGEDYAMEVVSPDIPGVVRELDSFAELADEFAFSRVYAGVHTIEGAVTDTATYGREIGSQVLENLLPLTEPATEEATV